MNKLLSEFSEVTQYVKGEEVVALAALQKQTGAKDQVVGHLISSFFGSIARNAVQGDWQEYLALTDKHLHHLRFQREDFKDAQTYDLDKIKSGSVQKDQTLVSVSFEYEGGTKSFKMWHYQLYTPAFEYLSEKEDMLEAEKMVLQIADKIGSR